METLGLVLRSIDYRDRQKIVTLFTPEGLFSFIIKGLNPKKPQLLQLTTPLTLAEYELKETRGELYRFVDGTPHTSHPSLRSSYATLEAGLTIAGHLLSTQLPGKPAPALYQLTLSYLANLPRDPATLLASFRIKLLKHEGLLNLSPNCLYCDRPALFLSRGESTCDKHRSGSMPLPSLHLDSRTFAKLTPIGEEEQEQIYRMFIERTCERGDSNPQEVSPTTTSR